MTLVLPAVYAWHAYGSTTKLDDALRNAPQVQTLASKSPVIVSSVAHVESRAAPLRPGLFPGSVPERSKYSWN